MPMFFPDLNSVRKLAKDMAEHDNEKKYNGLIPETEKDLSKARKQLADYLRDVWHDEIFALEVELAVGPEDYDEKMKRHIRHTVFNMPKIATKEKDWRRW